MTFTAAGWTLTDIITETRAITGRPDVSMMTDQSVVDFINRYYQYVLPKELKIFFGYTYYKFYTQANIDQYVAPTNFQTLNPNVYADGFPIEWYSDPDNFYSDYPEQLNKETDGTTNGISNSYTFTLTAYPVLPRSLYVTDGIQIAQDNGTGGFYDPNNSNAALSGSINYSSGAISGLGFKTISAIGLTITSSYQTYMANRPQGILFYKTQPLANSTQATRDGTNFFVLRPVPDQSYLIKMEGIQIPQALVNTTDVPFRTDLGPLIALGASIHIFKRFNQMDQIEQIMPEFNRYKDVCMQDTYEQYLYQRSVPAF